MIPVSAVLITKNEEKRIAKTLLALRDFQEIIVVDSKSQDKTREIAEQFGARVFVHPFDHFADQKNFAIKQAACDWVFSVNAGEIPDANLILAIKKVLEKKEVPEAGFKVRIKSFYFGREFRWGEQRKDWRLRFFRKEAGRFVSGVHEYVRVEGKTGCLPGWLMHESSNTVSEYLKKLVLYTELEAGAMKYAGKQPTLWRWGLKPFFRFFYYYVLRLGFLDGFEGFLFHSLSSLYLVVREVRLWEIRESR